MAWLTGNHGMKRDMASRASKRAFFSILFHEKLFEQDTHSLQNHGISHHHSISSSSSSRLIPRPSCFHTRQSFSLPTLVLLDSFPEPRVLLHAHLLLRVELVEPAQIHVLGEQRFHVRVESLPVRVFQVVSARLSQ